MSTTRHTSSMVSLFDRATEQSRTAAEHGFDWPDSTGVVRKVMEEVQELTVAVEDNDTSGIRHEMGDVLLALASLARHNNLSLEQSFQEAIERFDARWNKMAELLHSTGQQMHDLTPTQWEQLWEQAKLELDT